MIKTKRITSIAHRCDPVTGYESVNVLSWHQKDTKYYQLSPYHLRTDGHECISNHGGVIFENFWQGSKVYPSLPAVQQYAHPSKYGNPNYLWYSYPAVDMFRNEVILPTYYEWRNHLFDNIHPVRYPAGRNLQKTCLFSLVGEERLGYIEARKRLYFGEYQRLVQQIPVFHQLVNLLKTGHNLCIYEIDVPCATKKGLFSQVNPDGTYDCTIEKLNRLLIDPSEAFGHGLCLALTLLKSVNQNSNQ